MPDPAVRRTGCHLNLPGKATLMSGKATLMRMLRTSINAAALAVAGVVLVGCGSSTTPAAPSSAAPSSAAAGSTVAGSDATSLPAASSSPVPTPPESSPATPSSSSPAAAAAELRTAKTSLGTVVVTAKGLTAYYFDKDVQGSGKSACTGGCATAWPAITTTSTVPKVDGITGKVGTIALPDGKKQITIDGRPIYLFEKDTAPGDVKGQDVGEIWYVIGADGREIKS